MGRSLPLAHRQPERGLIPELQDLSVGDIVPDGEPGTAFYRVAVLDAPHALVLHSTSHVPPPLRGRMTVDWTWAYELRAVGATTTRLSLRVRATFQPWWVRLIYDGMIVPSDFIMARSMLRGIARRAEGRPSRGDLDDAGRREHEYMTRSRQKAGLRGRAPSGSESETRGASASHPQRVRRP